MVNGCSTTDEKYLDKRTMFAVHKMSVFEGCQSLVPWPDYRQNHNMGSSLFIFKTVNGNPRTHENNVEYRNIIDWSCKCPHFCMVMNEFWNQGHYLCENWFVMNEFGKLKLNLQCHRNRVDITFFNYTSAMNFEFLPP